MGIVQFIDTRGACVFAELRVGVRGAGAAHHYRAEQALRDVCRITYYSRLNASATSVTTFTRWVG
jgi:hypothetical protein